MSDNDTTSRQRTTPPTFEELEAMPNPLASSRRFMEVAPTGQYVAQLLKIEPAVALTGTPSFKITFQVPDGYPYCGRRFWFDLWRTDRAMPQTLRQLAKLGITDLADLERPLERWYKVKLSIAFETSPSGKERNRVIDFIVIKSGKFGEPPPVVIRPVIIPKPWGSVADFGPMPA